MVANESPRHSVSVAAAIVDDAGHLLATQRTDNGHWEPPGGVLELDEPIEDGLRREVREETGLEVTIEALTGAYKNLPRGIVALVFRCRVSGGDLHTSRETSSFRWLTPDEIRESMDEAYAIRMLDSLDDGPPHVRAHDGTRLVGSAEVP